MDSFTLVELPADCQAAKAAGQPQIQAKAGALAIEPDELWGSPDQEAWATIRGWHYPVQSDAFRQWLRGERHKRHLPISKNKIAEAVDLFAAAAVVNRPEHRVHLRTAQHKEAVFVDLADD